MVLMMLEMHTTEPLVPERSSFEVEICIEKLKRCKSPGIDQILTELIKAGCNALCSMIQNLSVLFGVRKNCHSRERNLLF
jgi:hypothetical protein